MLKRGEAVFHGFLGIRKMAHIFRIMRGGHWHPGMAGRKIRIAVRKSSGRYSGRKTGLFVQFSSNDQHRNQHNNYPDIECGALVFPEVIRVGGCSPALTVKSSN